MHDVINSKVLARKWRPQTFASTIGQDIVIKALEHALDKNRLHHAYLFTGTRGVGKTTISRLLAKALSCEVGISSKPCNTCSNCIAMQNGQYIDYIELDAASNRGVEEISQLLDNACYQPSQGRFKIFMIDEVHMLSNHAFNAMLKTLEEPPPHIKFILATTDAHKIPLTVISRCLQFHLKPLSIQNISQHLADILNKEKINFDILALQEIAKAANGSMRDALSISDQAIALGDGTIDVISTKSMLGLNDEGLVINILQHIAHHELESVLKLSQEIEQGDFFLDNLLKIVQKIAILQALSDKSIIEASEQIINLSHMFDKETLQIYHQMIIKTKLELSICAPEICLNMLFLRMMHFSMPLEKNLAINLQENKQINTSNNINKLDNLPANINNASNSNSLPKNTSSNISSSCLNSIIDNQDINLINSNNIPAKTIAKNNNSENNKDIENLNHQQWLQILPNLNLEGLSYEIIKQTIFKSYDKLKKCLYLSCSFDTDMMKSAINKIEQSIKIYFDTNIKIVYINSETTQKNHIEQNILAKPAITLKQQENQQHQEYIQQDEWLQDFVKIGAKIELVKESK